MKEIEINEVFKDAKAMQASDLHFSAGLPPVVRVHGKITHLPNYPKCSPNIIIDVINQITLQKHKESIRQGMDTDFCFVSNMGDRSRVNVYRQRGSHAIAMRLLRNKIPDMKDLNLPPIITEFADKNKGLILITGPTGAGKSTTLAAMVDYINRNKKKHIITIEDPIEYLHDHKNSMVNQREIHIDIDTFGNALRAALREDPDVILVGEMRDYETINAAVTAAETGHLILSTLHTTGAANTIDRIIDVYPTNSQGQCRAQLANVLIGVVSQVLVPTADGKGRVAALEIMAQSDAISSLIREGKIFQIPNAIATGRTRGMSTLDQNLAKLTKRGTITKEAALERCQDRSEYERLLISD